MKNFLTFILIFVCTASMSCERIDVHTIPLDIVYDFSKSSSDILEKTNSIGRFGAVIVTANASIDNCSVKVGYTQATLYIAKELKADSCAFEHILKHEKEHIAIYQTGLEKMKKDLPTATVNTMKAVEKEFDTISEEQKNYDSSEEYHLNKTACNCMIVKLVGLKKMF